MIEPAERPRLAVLFWFYKAFDVCRDRIALLRRLNPGVPVYGLYGGPLSEAHAAHTALGGLLDDFHAYPDPREPHWKWVHGDQLIADWHAARGDALAFDTLVVVQWDMLVLKPLAELFAELRPGEALFTGDRPLAEVADWWGWAGRFEEARVQMDAFTGRLRGEWGYGGELWCCLFILACLPRVFLDRYRDIGAPDEGFLEYKLPTLARAFGLPVRAATDLKPWWRADPATQTIPAAERLLNGVGEAVPLAAVLDELKQPGGQRLVHPFEGRFPPWLSSPTSARFAAAALRLRKVLP